MENNQKSYTALTIVITVLAIIIILVLAFLFYYYSTKPLPSSYQNLASLSGALEQQDSGMPEISATNVIKFLPPEILPEEQKEGSCFASSAAAPFRNDAWRCIAENTIYDPCFKTSKKGMLFCQMNPLAIGSFLISISEQLPEPSSMESLKNNWAWFLKLKNGTYCLPLAETAPVAEGEDVVFECSDKVLLSDLAEGAVWTAKIINSLEKVEIETVWQ